MTMDTAGAAGVVDIRIALNNEATYAAGNGKEGAAGGVPGSGQGACGGDL